ncbi:MAG: hypothetical protein ACE5R3_01445 [Nitrosopumilaceae archaeon]
MLIVAVCHQNAKKVDLQKNVLTALGMSVVAGKPFITSNQTVNRFVVVSG